jgi:hypothetical protein
VTKFVSLSTDERPTYAYHAPVAARLWKAIGYETIIHMHDDGRWNSPFGGAVKEELEAIGARTILLPTCAPLSAANTMRVCRLVAPCLSDLQPSDIVMTADVDMYPLSREFFSDPPRFGVLRALSSLWLAWRGDRPVVDWENNAAVYPDGRRLPLTPGSWAFQMCYASATVEIWREMFNYVPDSPILSMGKLLEGCTGDSTELDEIKVSYAFLSSKRATGEWIAQSSDGPWRKGELVFSDPMAAPLLARFTSMPRGMMSSQREDWKGGKVDGAIDFIPPRITPGEVPLWALELAALYWPEEKSWLEKYAIRMDGLTGGAFPWR